MLDLPQPLAEASPLVGLAEPLLGLLVREEVFGAKQSRLMGAEEEDLVAVGFSDVLDPRWPVGIALQLGKHQVPGLVLRAAVARHGECSWPHLGDRKLTTASAQAAGPSVHAQWVHHEDAGNACFFRMLRSKVGIIS